MPAPRASLAALLGLVLGCQGGDSDSTQARSAKLDHTRRQIDQLTYEAYPQWVMHPGRGACPTLDELREFAARAPIDPWGRALRLRCDDLPPGAIQIAIWSLGPDGKDRTADDLYATRY